MCLWREPAFRTPKAFQDVRHCGGLNVIEIILRRLERMAPDKTTHYKYSKRPHIRCICVLAPLQAFGRYVCHSADECVDLGDSGVQVTCQPEIAQFRPTRPAGQQDICRHPSWSRGAIHDEDVGTTARPDSFVRSSARCVRGSVQRVAQRMPGIRDPCTPTHCAHLHIHRRMHRGNAPDSDWCANGKFHSSSLRSWIVPLFLAVADDCSYTHCGIRRQVFRCWFWTICWHLEVLLLVPRNRYSDFFVSVSNCGVLLTEIRSE